MCIRDRPVLLLLPCAEPDVAVCICSSGSHNPPRRPAPRPRRRNLARLLDRWYASTRISARVLMPAWAMYAFLSRGSCLFHVPVSIPSVFLTVLSCCCRSFQMSFLPGSLTRRSPVCPPDDELLVGRHGGADGSHLDGHGGSSWDLLLLYCSGKIRPRLCIQKNQNNVRTARR